MQNTTTAYIFIAIMTFIVFSCTSDLKEQEKETQIFYKKGRKLFAKHCDQCHASSMTYDMTAPALGYVLEKRDSAWLRYYIKKGSYARRDNDSIALALRARGWGFMTGFDFLKDEEIESILFYIEEEFKKNKEDPLYKRDI